MNSNQSYFITGPGGSGKTLLKIVGWWYDYSYFLAKLKKQSQIQTLDLDYIFIDEVSMIGEVYHKFLTMIKKTKSDIKYIISGDNNQLKPINDRTAPKPDYYNSCLFELADYNKLQSTKCRSADNTLYNSVKFDNIPNAKPSDFKETSEYKNDIKRPVNVRMKILKFILYDK